MADKGYVLLHRSILDHWIWKNNEPFTYGQAWIDLILLANHADQKIMLNHNFVTIQRGQHHTSVKKLAERWNWSCNKVRHYLRLLVCDGMLQVEGTPQGTTLTLVNYGVQQDWTRTKGRTKGRAKGTTDSTIEGTSEGTQTKNDIKNDIKNEEKMKKSSARKGESDWQ